MFRQNAPNLSNLLATIVVVLVVIYFQVSKSPKIQHERVKNDEKPPFYSQEQRKHDCAECDTNNFLRGLTFHTKNKTCRSNKENFAN